MTKKFDLAKENWKFAGEVVAHIDANLNMELRSKLYQNVIHTLLDHPFVDDELNLKLKETICIELGVEYFNSDEESEQEEAAAEEDKDHRRGLYGPEYEGENF